MWFHSSVKEPWGHGAHTLFFVDVQRASRYVPGGQRSHSSRALVFGSVYLKVRGGAADPSTRLDASVNSSKSAWKMGNNIWKKETGEEDAESQRETREYDASS